MARVEIVETSINLLSGIGVAFCSVRTQRSAWQIVEGAYLRGTPALWPRSLSPDVALCPTSGVSFEQMFELPNSTGGPASPTFQVETDGSAPIEFTFRGRRFRIHNVLNRWCEAGGWWNRISDGIYRPDDNARAIWRVEAAPIGAVTTFELERDETTGKWLIRIV